jgi:hypothetical protein
MDCEKGEVDQMNVTLTALVTLFPAVQIFRTSRIAQSSAELSH